MDPHAACQSRIAAHFTGRISPADEREMREHIDVCETCHRRYRRHWLLDSLDPASLGPRDRMGYGLGLLRPKRLAIRPVGGLLVALAAAWCLTVGVPYAVQKTNSLGSSSSFFQARGASSMAPVGIEIYRGRAGGPFELVTQSIRGGDELAFAYTNRAAYRYLSVCGVDSHGRVFWFYPAWTDPQANPEAISIEAGAHIRELPEAVSHVIDGSELRIISVFSERPLHVREMEDRIGQARRRGLALSAVLSNDFGAAAVIERTLTVSW